LVRARRAIHIRTPPGAGLARRTVWRQSWRHIHISAFDTANFRPDTETHIPGLVTPRWAEEAQRNWGIENPVFQVRVLGDFPSWAADTLIPLRLIEQAIQRPAGPAEAASRVLRLSKGRVLRLSKGEAGLGFRR
jgi:hypothetical protein